MPVPSIRLAVVRGPSPASISTVPAGVRRALQFPMEPEARMQSSRDIRVRERVTIRQANHSRVFPKLIAGLEACTVCILMNDEKFPIDLSVLKPLKLDPNN